MKKFEGFPPRMEFTPLPNVLFSRLLPEISDIAELKVILYVMAALYRKRGHPRFVTFAELRGDTVLLSSLKSKDEPPEAALQSALGMAVGRGVLLQIALEKAGGVDDVYLLNTVANRKLLEQIRSGEVKLNGVKAAGTTDAVVEPLPDVFTLYEQNIGMLTPMIAEELGDFEGLYPEEWIKDAIKESALHNKRNIKYIARILESWAAEGRSDGAYQRHSKKTGPDKYFGGKYGHMVQR